MDARGDWCWSLVIFVMVNGSFSGGGATGFCGCACGG